MTVLLFLLAAAQNPADACRLAESGQVAGITMLAENADDPDEVAVLAAGEDGRAVRVAHVRCDHEPGQMPRVTLR